MNEIFLAGTSKSPTITYSKGHLSIAGCSLPSDAKKIFKNIQNFFEKSDNFKEDTYLIEVRFEYCDTASLKWILTILQTFIKNASTENIEIRWYYESDDYEMLELGEFVKTRIKTRFDMISLPPN